MMLNICMTISPKKRHKADIEENIFAGDQGNQGEVSDAACRAQGPTRGKGQTGDAGDTGASTETKEIPESSSRPRGLISKETKMTKDTSITSKRQEQKQAQQQPASPRPEAQQPEHVIAYNSNHQNVQQHAQQQRVLPTYTASSQQPAHQTSRVQHQQQRLAATVTRPQNVTGSAGSNSSCTSPVTTTRSQRNDPATMYQQAQGAPTTYHEATPTTSCPQQPNTHPTPTSQLYPTHGTYQPDNNTVTSPEQLTFVNKELMDVVQIEAYLRKKGITGKRKKKKRYYLNKKIVKVVKKQEEVNSESDSGKSYCETVVPIFPFETYCEPHQFPVSTVPFVDSHCHIDYLFVREQNFGSFASYVASKDFPKNFSGCVANFCDPPAWGENQMYDEILEEDGIWGAFGLHPHNAKHWCAEVERDLLRAASHPKCVAWGEMGLDYGTKRTSTFQVMKVQKDVFMAQIRHALRLDKPLVIHGRGAEMDTFEIMKEMVPKEHRIHFHCYSGSWSTARIMLTYFTNIYLGFTGLVTFHTASNVQEVARKVPLERLLIETDAPYMKPSNAKHVDRNSPRSSSPAMCLWVAAKIAEIRKVELDDVLKQVRLNVKDMYGI